MKHAAPSEASITRWFSALREGDREAEGLLYSHFFPKIVSLARSKFDADRDPVRGAEAAAQSVFQLLAQGAKEGRFEQVVDRDNLWRILVVATRRKVIDQIRRKQSLKRGGGLESVPLPDLGAEDVATPEAIVAMQEQLSFLFEQLRDDTLRSIASDRLAGYTNDEIASRRGISTRTVERKLRLIRDDWKKLSSEG